MKKLIALTLVVLLLAAVFAGCTEKPETPPTSTPESAGGEAPPAEGGELKQVVVGINADYVTFDPAHAYEHSANMIFRGVYSTLVTFEPTATDTPVGDAATDWTISEDGKVYTFNLNPEITFTSGNPLTANDVKWSFERLQTVKGNPSFLADNIVSVEAPDDVTAVITLAEVDPSFLTKLSKYNFAVVDSVYVQETCADEAAIETFLMSNSAGSGAYVISTFELNSELILERNPAYNRELPPIDRFVFKHVSDPGTQLMSLQKGDLDFALDLDDTQIQTLTEDANIQIVNKSTVSIFFYLMNADPEIGGPLANEKVREAISLAVDYEGIRLLAGSASTTPYSIIPTGLLGAKTELENAKVRDVEKAKALLTEAGFENGFEVSCAYIPDMAPDGVSFATMAEKLQADMADIGITVTLVPEQVSVFLENYRSGKHQMNVNMWGPDYPDSLAQIAFLPGETVGLRANWTAEMYPELAELAAKIKVAVDDAERAELIGQAQDMMQNGPFIVYLQPGRTFACSSRMTNVEYSPAFLLEILYLDIAE